MAWYTPEQKKFIHDIAQGRYNSEIAELFQAEFGIEVSAGQIKSFKANHKIKSNVPRKRITGDEGLFNQKQKEFIENNVEGRKNQELADLVNEKFDLRITAKQMNTYKKNHNLVSGLDCRFQEGSTPVNKGTKGLYNVGGNRTSFRTGQRPSNFKPVGTERIDRDGYTLIKVSDEGPWHKRWRHKHKIVWEEKHGPIPKGHAILFADQNKQNVQLDNLLLITKSQLSILNTKQLLYNDAELTKTGVIMADIIKTIGERRRKRK